MRSVVVARPRNRRVALLDQAVRPAGLTARRVGSWAQLLGAGRADFAADEPEGQPTCACVAAEKATGPPPAR